MMSSTNRNGNGNSDVEPRSLPPKIGTDWRHKDFSDPQVTRSAFVEISEFAAASIEGHSTTHTQIAGLRGALGGEVSDRARQDGVVLAALARMEKKLDESYALAQVTATRVQRLDNERELPISMLNGLEKDIDLIKRHNLQRDKREAVARAKLEERLNSLSKKTEEVEDDVEDTGQRLINLTLEQARKIEADLRAREAEARASLSEIQDEQREIDKERRDDTRWWTRQRIAWAVAIGMALWSAALATGVGLLVHK